MDRNEVFVDCCDLLERQAAHCVQYIVLPHTCCRLVNVVVLQLQSLRRSLILCVW